MEADVHYMFFTWTTLHPVPRWGGTPTLHGNASGRCYLVSPPCRQVTVSHTYAPQLFHIVGFVSCYMKHPEDAHLAAVKAILRYLRRYPSADLYFAEGEESCLLRFSDADFTQDINDRIFTGAYLFVLGTTPISWSLKKRTTAARSSCDAKYRALSTCACEANWLRKLLTEIGFTLSGPMILHCDNQSTIKLSKNPVIHEKTNILRRTCTLLDRWSRQGRLRLNTYPQPRTPQIC